MKSKFYLSFLIGFLIFLSFLVKAGSHEDIKEFKKDPANEFMSGIHNAPYLSPTPGKIPIIALHPSVLNHKPYLSDFISVKECGFNVTIFNGPDSTIDKVCDFAEQSGLKLIIGSEELRSSKCKRFVEKYKDKQSIVGWYLKDEPKYNDLDSIKRFYDIIRETDPKSLVRINLIGGITPGYTGDYKNYMSYLNRIQDIFKPGVWSYDYYPISIHNGKIRVIYDTFYSDLEYFNYMASLTNRPFWAHCQSMAYKNNDIERPEATQPYLRFVIFSSLAYGAQGIIYWTYTQRQSIINNFKSALVNKDGRRTPAWYAAQKVNQEINLFSHIFLNTKIKNVVHSGSNKIKDTQILELPWGPLKAVRNNQSGFLFSHIITDEKEYLVVVNHDVINSQSLDLSFIHKDVILLQPAETIRGLRIIEKNINDRYNGKVPPGNYLIFKLPQNTI